VSKVNISNYSFILICFCLPFALYVNTMSTSLGFIDAAEFALVSFLGSVAHPPGTPSYVFIGWIWTKTLSIFMSDKVAIICLLSVFSVALSTVINYMTFQVMSKEVGDKKFDQFRINVASLAAALSISLGMTFWNWANAVEVYGFQILCGSIMLYGLTCYQVHRNYLFLTFASIGYALGLANHHLYMILFTPLILFYFSDNLFSNPKKKQPKFNVQALLDFFKDTLTSKHFLFLAGLTTLITCGFYFWMMIRAGLDFQFEFGNPDNGQRLWEHITGKVYTKLLIGENKNENMFYLKLIYFSKMIFNQYFFFLPFVIIGFVIVLKKRLYKLFFIISFYFAFNLWMHLQAPTASGDEEGHMVIPFLVLGLLTIYGIQWIVIKMKYYWLILGLVIFQIGFTYAKVDKSDYDISESLMHELDRSAPKNSIVLISDWTLVIQYYYYRIANNFRTDLVVLNYDIKFTNYKIIPIVYPEFYKLIEKEYMTFVKALEKEHPHQIYNTGCTLSSVPLNNAFGNLIRKFESLSNERDGALLLDPKAYYSYMNLIKFTPKKSYPSGCFVSNKLIDPVKEYLNLEYKWLESDLLLNDAKADNKVVDIEAMLDIHKRYYKNIGDTENYNLAEKAHLKVKNIQKRMKLSMPQIYEEEFKVNQSKQKKKKKGEIYFNPPVN